MVLKFQEFYLLISISHKSMHSEHVKIFMPVIEEARGLLLLLKALGEVSLVGIFGARVRFPNT